jgi:hypothetical protein
MKLVVPCNTLHALLQFGLTNSKVILPNLDLAPFVSTSLDSLGNGCFLLVSGLSALYIWVIFLANEAFNPLARLHQSNSTLDVNLIERSPWPVYWLLVLEVAVSSIHCLQRLGSLAISFFQEVLLYSATFSSRYCLSNMALPGKDQLDLHYN